jgi:CHRD domain-containing protein
MRSKAALALVSLGAAPLIGAASPSKLEPDARSFTVSLTGRAEAAEVQVIGTAGDMDGSGEVRLTADPASRQICYRFELSDVATPLMAHIHKGRVLTSGPSVVTLFTGPGGDLANCLLWTQKWVDEIVANPAGFYVNLYTTEYPDGALRGQLLG